MRTGTADLPLHGGKAPPWLFKRMVKLSGAIVEALEFEYGVNEVLKRLSDPYWFQAFACAIGFDWHSSGTTTTACGALKLALNGKEEEYGVSVGGGKGKASRKTPEEIRKVGGEVFGLSEASVEGLVKASVLSAKVDNSCVQDDYQLYHHCLFFTEKGEWCVVQQGMNEENRYARRYHWLGEKVESFVNEPHSAICCDERKKQALNMVARESSEARKASVDLVKDNPEHLKKYFMKGQSCLNDFDSLVMPAHHPVLPCDLSEKDFAVLKSAYELQPENYEELFCLKGIGAKKIRALALLSDLLFGVKASWNDPVKYSFAHGGKDGYPYPVDRQAYDYSIETLKQAVENAKLGEKEKYEAVKRLKECLLVV
ncbi:DUF763 domain-containing protein [Candidatus Micrarchaeota archaeon]|nr:DUF763 domain-containing protein [Candidatus Micrarchaeota archaeon]